MDAELVWNTWRRILTSDPLLDAVLLDPGGDRVRAMGFSGDELAIIENYASTPSATDTNVGMYRRGLTRNTLASLSLAPLSQHRLYTSGADVEAVAADHVRSRGYADDGPNFWRIVGGFLTSLAGRPEFATQPWQDVLALDSAMVALARRLGLPGTGDELEGRLPADGEGGRPPREGGPLFVASPMAAVVSSRLDLTPWLEAPHGYDPTERLVETPKHWAIVFPAGGAAPDYAELSERAARVHGALSSPRTLAQIAAGADDIPDAALRTILDDLVRLGVVIVGGDGEGGGAGPSPRARDPRTLLPGQLVKLDPEVEVWPLDGSGRRTLIHRAFATGLAVPEGDGFPDLLDMLSREPVRVGELRGAFDDRALIDQTLDSLRSRGFLLLLADANPTNDSIARAREAARSTRDAGLRHRFVVDLDAAAQIEQIGSIERDLGEEKVPPFLILRCARLGDHERLVEGLAELRQSGRLRVHDTRVRTQDASCASAIHRHLIRLGATVVIEGVPWPAPDGPIPGLAGLAAACVPVVAAMRPDRSIHDPTTRDRAAAWARTASVAGLRLHLDADGIELAHIAEGEGLRRLFRAVGSLHDAVGSVVIDNLPDDDVLLGDAASPPLPDRSCDGAKRLRDAYLRWRLGVIASSEQGTLWAQTVDAEEKVVPSEVDFFPRHPELLSLRPGAVLVDVCGGLGRVARRLSPAVGRDGLVLSVEMLRWVGDRARHVACRSGVTNVQFREGLAQRIGLPDGSADAAINEWTGAIWELGLGRAMVGEMARIVRPGGRVAVTHRLARLPLDRLHEPWIQYPDIHRWMREAFADPRLTIVAERVWGQVAPSLVGESPAAWRRRYLPRLIDPVEPVFESEEHSGPHADVCLSIVAQRR